MLSEDTSVKSKKNIFLGKTLYTKNWIKKYPYIWFIVPGFILYSIFSIYPILSAAKLSLYYSNGFGVSHFVGIQNYIELFTTKELINQFLNAIKNNLILFVLNILLVLPIQIYLAYLIHTKIRGYRFFQSIIFAPQFITPTVVLFLATLMLDQNIGVFNAILRGVGLTDWTRNWLGIPGLGIYIVFILNAWVGIGFSMIYFIGAMKMLPEEVFEAAYLDGAGYWGRLFYIVIPMLKSTIVNVVVISYIFSMTTFDLNYLLGGVYGGNNHSMDVMTLFFYRTAFGTGGETGGTISSNSIGMGTTIAVVMFIIILLAALLQLRFSMQKEDN